MSTSLSTVEEALQKACIICNRASSKRHPMRECATCSKTVHRRCTNSPAGSLKTYCLLCMSAQQKEVSKEMKEKRKSTTATPSKILSRVSSTHLSKENNTSKSRKTINSITSTHNSSSSATGLPRRSINTESSCSKNYMKNLEVWKTSFQLKLDSLLEKLDQIEKINDYISKMFPVYKHNHLLTLN